MKRNSKTELYAPYQTTKENKNKPAAGIRRFLKVFGIGVFGNTDLQYISAGRAAWLTANASCNKFEKLPLVYFIIQRNKKTIYRSEERRVGKEC